MVKVKNLQNKDIFLFGIASLIWLLLGQVICKYWSSVPEEQFSACIWMFGLWFLCVLDLLVLRKLISIVFQIVSSVEGNGPVYFLQALFWGVSKVLCLGLFIIVLLKGQKIPMHGLLLGIGTLGVVPVFGGFLWSQRVLSNA